MHMVDVFFNVNSAVGTALWGSAVAMAYSSKRFKVGWTIIKFQFMGVMGAFVFAAQMD